MRKNYLSLLMLLVVLIVCIKGNKANYIVKNGTITKSKQYNNSCSIYKGTLDLFEEFYYDTEDRIYLVIKAKKITSTSYYRDFEDTTRVIDVINDEPIICKIQNIVYYTLSDFYITDILKSDTNYKIGDRITVLEPYAFRPKERWGNEIIIEFGYNWPLMRNDKEYLIFLKTTKDKCIKYGYEDIKDEITNVWQCSGVFLLEKEIIEKTQKNLLDNSEHNYGPYPELYGPIFKKYLNIEIDKNIEQKATFNPSEKTPLPKITPMP